MNRNPVGGRVRAGLTFALLLAGAVLAAPGGLDPTFHRDGRVETRLRRRGGDGARAVVVQPDGKVVIAGYTPGPGLTDFLVARYTAGGALDREFGARGLVKLSFMDNEGALALVRQEDGKLVVGGGTSTPTGQEGRFALARLNEDGSLDESFGSGGKVTTPVADSGGVIWGLAIQSDGRIVAAGSSVSSKSGLQLAVARYLENGDLDASFSEDGIATALVPPHGGDGGRALTLDSQERPVVVSFSLSASGSRTALVRFTADGELDPGFGSGGISILDVAPEGGGPRAIVAQGDKLLVAGVGVTLINQEFTQDFSLVRVDSAGSLDPTFGDQGRVLTPIGTANDDAYGLALDSQGRIVVGGVVSIRGTRGHADFGVVRYTPEGQLDTTFGAGGKVTANFGYSNRRRRQPSIDLIYAVAVGPGDEIVAAGTTDTASGGPAAEHIAIARFLP